MKYAMQEVFTCNLGESYIRSHIAQLARNPILTENTADKRRNLSQATTLQHAQLSISSVPAQPWMTPELQQLAPNFLATFLVVTFLNNRRKQRPSFRRHHHHHHHHHKNL